FVRAPVRTPGALGQPLEPFGPIAGQPFITGRPADTEPPAKLAHICIWLLGKHDKFFFKFHFCCLLPGHLYLLFGDKNTYFWILVKCKESPRTPVKDVSGLDTPSKGDTP